MATLFNTKCAVAKIVIDKAQEGDAAVFLLEIPLLHISTLFIETKYIRLYLLCGSFDQCLNKLSFISHVFQTKGI